MSPTAIRIAAAVLSVVGSALLAWRVKGLLEALASVSRVHEQNIKNISEAMDGSALLLFTNSTKAIERAEKFGLLVLGFGCLGISGVLQVVAQVLQ